MLSQMLYFPGQNPQPSIPSDILSYYKRFTSHLKTLEKCKRIKKRERVWERVRLWEKAKSCKFAQNVFVTHKIKNNKNHDWVCNSHNQWFRLKHFLLSLTFDVKHLVFCSFRVFANYLLQLILPWLHSHLTPDYKVSVKDSISLLHFCFYFYLLLSMLLPFLLKSRSKPLVLYFLKSIFFIYFFPFFILCFLHYLCTAFVTIKLITICIFKLFFCLLLF